MSYLTGHVKRHRDTHDVAVRTAFPEDTYPDMAWLVATIHIGPRTATTAEVSDWDDLYSPIS